jgi:hypothetical protein
MLSLFAALTARAGSVTVSGGDTVIFTFDFTRQGANTPPYPAMRVDTGIDLRSLDDLDRCRYTLYRDGNAIDPDSSIVACGILAFEAGEEASGWLDGLLSIALTVLEGSVTLNPHAIAFSAFGPDGKPLTPRMRPRLRIVDEPSALLLTLLVTAPVWSTLRRVRRVRPE